MASKQESMAPSVVVSGKASGVVVVVSDLPVSLCIGRRANLDQKGDAIQLLDPSH